MNDDEKQQQQQRHQDLTDIRAIAEKSFAFIKLVLAPLISLGIASLIGGCWQVHDMGRDFRAMQAAQVELNTKLEAMNEKVLRMFYAGGWDKTDKERDKREARP
jgi:hypothetical protein